MEHQCPVAIDEFRELLSFPEGALAISIKKACEQFRAGDITVDLTKYKWDQLVGQNTQIEWGKDHVRGAILSEARSHGFDAEFKDTPKFSRGPAEKYGKLVLRCTMLYALVLTCTSGGGENILKCTAVYTTGQRTPTCVKSYKRVRVFNNLYM